MVIFLCFILLLFLTKKEISRCENKLNNFILKEKIEYEKYKDNIDWNINYLNEIIINNNDKLIKRIERLEDKNDEKNKD